ncbi:MAG: hypothetical protein ACRDNF_22580 [Streptosporangiaceae bacterium]
MPSGYCPHCGQPAGAHGHQDCRRASALDPPRYCTECGRRLVVKVTPDRWTAQCSQHGAHDQHGARVTR